MLIKREIHSILIYDKLHFFDFTLSDKIFYWNATKFTYSLVQIVESQKSDKTGSSSKHKDTFIGFK